MPFPDKLLKTKLRRRQFLLVCNKAMTLGDNSRFRVIKTPELFSSIFNVSILSTDVNLRIAMPVNADFEASPWSLLPIYSAHPRTSTTEGTTRIQYLCPCLQTADDKGDSRCGRRLTKLLVSLMLVGEGLAHDTSSFFLWMLKWFLQSRNEKCSFGTIRIPTS